MNSKNDNYPDSSKEKGPYQLKQKVKCKSCDRTLELDEPVRLLRTAETVQQGSLSKTKQACLFCGNQHEYTSNEVQNLFE